MARLKCLCGNILSNSGEPEIEYNIFSDDEWNELIDRTENGEKPLDFTGYTHTLWKCPKCKRLYVFEVHNDTPQIYNLEEDNGIKW